MKFKQIPISLIFKRDNVRDEPEDELGDLQDSLDRFDMLSPILVRTVGAKYEIIAGHRRFMAAKLHGDLFIPSIIRDDITEQDRIYVQITENTHRKQMSCFELTAAFDRLKRENHGLTNAGIAQRIGRSTAWVANQYGAAKMSEKMTGCQDLNKLTSGQIMARARKSGIVGGLKGNEKVKVSFSGNNVKIQCKSKTIRNKVIALIEKEYGV